MSVIYPFPSRIVSPYSQYGIVRKPSQFAPAFSVVDATNQAIKVSAGLQVMFKNRLIAFDADTVIPLDTGALAIGSDYAIYVTSYGTLIFSLNFTAPAGYDATNSLLVGGFHYAPGGLGKVVAAVGYGDGAHLSVGSNTKVASTAFYFSISGGASTLKAAVAAGTALPAQTVPANKWALYRLSIIADGTITVTPAALNTTGYNTEALAVAALPAVPANSAAMGFLTVQTAAGLAFVANTDALAGGTGGNPATTTNYYPESSTGAQINPYSIWDLKFRPACQDPRGMALAADGRWDDIYFLGTNPDVDGTSKYGATIADGASLPKIPAAFGGDGSAAYTALSWYVATEIAAAYGKRLPGYSEFVSAAFGVQEGAALGFDPVTTSRSGPRTSAHGLVQATGNMYVWGQDVGTYIPPTTGPAGSPPTAADLTTWITSMIAPSWKATGRGNAYTYGANGLAAVLLGGGWGTGSPAGSRCSNWSYAPWGSTSNIGARFRSDPLRLP